MSKELNSPNIYTEFCDNILMPDEKISSPCGFGVSYLDDSLSGIYANDLVLIGAKTGAGKSHLATIIAMHNAIMGKRVAFFALESEFKEVERRVLYQRIANKFFSRSRADRPNVNLNFQDWRYQKLPQLDHLHQEAIEEFRNDIQIKMKMYYRKPGDKFNSSVFKKIMCEYAKDFDLIVCDHVHFFDFETHNENIEMRETLKEIRDASIVCGVPVLLVAHIRKADKKLKQVVPDADDFHGSSDLTKIPTKIITMAPSKDSAFGGFMTNMRVCKNRADGERARYMARCFFDTNKQNYSKDYLISKCFDSQEEPVWLKDSEIPQWAVNARSSLIL